MVAASTERPLVLVVDPDRSARAVLEVALSRDGFDVWSAETADQGLAVLRRGRTPDVIDLESDLGQGGAGFAFCAQLRGEPRTSRVPVVLLARADDANVANLAEVVGVDEAVQKPAFARDVVALVRFELVRHRSSPGALLRFGARTLPPAHLLRALLTSARAGVVSLAGGLATVRFADGAVVDAQFGTRWGIDALVRALALTTTDYTISLEPVARTTGFSCSLRDFVALVLPRLSKWSQISARSLPLDAVLAVDFGRLAHALPSMPDDINRIVQLFDGRRRVHDVLVDSTFDELLTLEVATRLYLMGVVGPVPGGAVTEAQLRAAPRLFEPRSAEAEDLMRQLFDGVTEIRAADVEPAKVDDDAEWSVPPAAHDLDVDDPAGGWQAAAIPESHVFDGVEDEVARTLAAFNPPTVVEPREPRAEERPVAAFAQGDDVVDDSLEAAFRSATGDDEAQAVMVGDPTPPSPARRFSADDRQERIITPVLNPVVQLPPAVGDATAEGPAPLSAALAPVSEGADAEPGAPGTGVAHGLTPVDERSARADMPPPTTLPVRIVKAPQIGSEADSRAAFSAAQPEHPVPVQTVDREAAFFAAEPEAFEDTVPAQSGAAVVDPEAAFFTAAQPEAFEDTVSAQPGAAVVDPEAAFFTAEPEAFEDTVPAQTGAQPRRVGVLLLALAAAALLVAVGVEALSRAPDLAHVSTGAVIAAPTPVAPAPAVSPELPAATLEPVALVEPEVEAAPEALDVTEALSDGVRAYQRGEYTKAVAILEQVVADAPASVQGWLVLGQARYDAGDAKGAREAAATVLKLDPKHAGVHVLLATIAYDANDKVTMRQELETYLSLEPEGPHAAEAKALLQR
ncbi:MAG: response regulator [Myxococcaceae bacterium]|nr:response regulator [Myxococcaceae bacterium]